MNRIKWRLAFQFLFLFSMFSPLFSFAQPVGANMSNPVVMGTYGGGTFSYNDTKNNSTSNGYLNDYGQASDDIYYKFTVQGSTQISISHCSSGFDTYVHLLNSTGSLIVSNDDNGPLCSGTRASLQTTIAAGTYYIVSEGYGSNTGDIAINVTLNVEAPPLPLGARISNPIVIGTYGPGSFSYTDTKNNSTSNGYLNDYGQVSDDIYYKFTVQGSTQISISHCSSGFDTYVHLLSSTGSLIVSNDDNGPLCSGTRASLQTTIAAGTYYIVSEGYGSNSGSITTSVTLTVTAGPPLYGGYVTNPNQTIQPNTVPTQINATVATGGNCGGSYSYQWQSAITGGNYTNIPGATGQNYQPGALSVTTHFNRVTTCNGEVAYLETTGLVTVIQPLNGGCITSGDQQVLFGNLPGTIMTTQAIEGNCNGNYSYQWQSSTDNIYFYNIAGATLQNLSFSTPLSQTTWFQRKTTCGSEVKYTGSVKVTMTSTITYYNADTSAVFTRNNCGAGYTGSNVTYTVPANTYSSTVSQQDANQLAQNDINANGQNYANANGTCTQYCSFAASPGFSLITSSISSSGSTVSFYIVFYSTSGTTYWSSTNQIATINGGCRPSVNRTLTMTESGRTWEVIISTWGSVNVRLVSGTPPSGSNGIGLTGGSYSL